MMKPCCRKATIKALKKAGELACQAESHALANFLFQMAEAVERGKK